MPDFFSNVDSGVIFRGNDSVPSFDELNSSFAQKIWSVVVRWLGQRVYNL